MPEHLYRDVKLNREQINNLTLSLVGLINSPQDLETVLLFLANNLKTRANKLDGDEGENLTLGEKYIYECSVKHIEVAKSAIENMLRCYDEGKKGEIQSQDLNS